MNMKTKVLIYVVYILLIGFSVAWASPNETLPTYHWAYEYIQALQDRGYCIDLLRLNLPYTRGDVARSLVSLNTILENRPSEDAVHRMMRRLMEEFEFEIGTLQKE